MSSLHTQRRRSTRRIRAPDRLGTYVTPTIGKPKLYRGGVEVVPSSNSSSSVPSSLSSNEDNFLTPSNLPGRRLTNRAQEGRRGTRSPMPNAEDERAEGETPADIGVDEVALPPPTYEQSTSYEEVRQRWRTASLALIMRHRCNLRGALNELSVWTTQEKGSASASILVAATVKHSSGSLDTIDPSNTYRNRPGFNNMLLKVSPLTEIHIDNGLQVEDEVYQHIVPTLRAQTPHLVASVGSFTCTWTQFEQAFVNDSVQRQRLVNEWTNVERELNMSDNPRDQQQVRVLVLERSTGIPLVELMEEHAPFQEQNLALYGALAVQLFYTLYCFEQIGLRQNDLHKGNILVEQLDEERVFQYDLGQVGDAGATVVLEIRSRYVARIFDFDRASIYHPHVHRNMKLDQDLCLPDGRHTVCAGPDYAALDAFGLALTLHHDVSPLATWLSQTITPVVEKQVEQGKVAHSQVAWFAVRGWPFVNHPRPTAGQILADLVQSPVQWSNQFVRIRSTHDIDLARAQLQLFRVPLKQQVWWVVPTRRMAHLSTESDGGPSNNSALSAAHMTGMLRQRDGNEADLLRSAQTINTRAFRDRIQTLMTTDTTFQGTLPSAMWTRELELLHYNLSAAATDLYTRYAQQCLNTIGVFDSGNDAVALVCLWLACPMYYGLPDNIRAALRSGGLATVEDGNLDVTMGDIERDVWRHFPRLPTPMPALNRMSITG